MYSKLDETARRYYNTTQFSFLSNEAKQVVIRANGQSAAQLDSITRQHYNRNKFSELSAEDMDIVLKSVGR